MIIPGFGVISEVIPCFSRRKIFGYKFMALAMMAIAILGFLVWGHHMFVTGQSMYAGIVFSIISFMIGVPTAVKVFNWTTTLYKGSITADTPMLYALGYLGMPRRYHEYPAEFQTLNIFSSAGATILAVGYGLPLIYLLLSLKFGPVAGPNPWGATGLEWQLPSPPITHNFETTPIVNEDPYEYELQEGPSV